MCRRVDERTRGRADERTGVGMLGGRADGGGQWADGLADWRTGGRGRTGGRRISEGKIPDLTRHLTWPWEIQRGRSRVTVKLPHYLLRHGNDRVRHDFVLSSCRFCRDVVTEQGPSRHNRQPWRKLIKGHRRIREITSFLSM